MKRYLNIPQETIINSRLDLDLQDACLLDFIVSFSHSNTIRKEHLHGKVYFWFDYGHVAVNLPLIRLAKDSIYRRFKKYVELGLLEPHPDNVILRRPYYTFTNKLMSLLYVGFESDSPENFPSNPGRFSEVTPEIFPTDSNIIDSNIKDSNKVVPPFTGNEFKEAWLGYESMRKKIKKPLNEYSTKLAYGTLLKLSCGNESVAVKILEQSIFNSWQGLFELRESSSESQDNSQRRMVY